MKRYQLRMPLAAVLLIAAVIFGATTWLAAHVAIGTNALEPLVITALVAGIGSQPSAMPRTYTERS